MTSHANHHQAGVQRFRLKHDVDSLHSMLAVKTASLELLQNAISHAMSVAFMLDIRCLFASSYTGSNIILLPPSITSALLTITTSTIIPHHRCRKFFSCSIQKFLHARCPQCSTHHSPKLSSTSKSTLEMRSSLFSPQITQGFGAVPTSLAA